MNTDLEITLEFLDSPTEVDFFAVAGAPGHDGQDGADGADGHTPVITATKSGKTTTVSVDGNPVAQILDGADGQPGQDGQDGSPGQDGADGHSPVVTASKSGKVTTVSVDGEPIATINDGNDGQNGQDGHTPVKGTDYWTAADKAEIVAEAAGAVDIPAVASGAQVKGGSASSVFIAPGVEDAASFYGLAKAAGDSTQSASSNAVGNYTDAAKVAIQKMLGIYEPPWELVNDITLTESTSIDLSADMYGTPYNFISICMEIVVPANSETAQGYGRYRVYDIDGHVVYVETGSYTNNSSVQYKDIYLLKDSNMARLICSRYTGLGNTASLYIKPMAYSNTYIGFGNIVSIKTDSYDFEPAGANIKIYAKRAY